MTDIFPYLQHEIMLAMAQGMHIDDVHRQLIDPADLTEEEKAAMWLLAWSLNDPVKAQREAEAHDSDWFPPPSS